ncbi:MAG: helix-turn-helix domain-containing protein [Ignavibacteria bacterium]|nr:helix-turn-helix domain-containing protein [Ignavibacteria bacterium]
MANYNPNKVKINRSYSYEELAAVYGVHKNTVAAWVRNGLPCLKEMRPYLILGADAREYLQMQRQTKKQICKPNELFCMRCKKPTRTLDNRAQYFPLTANKGRLRGLCCTCKGVVNKFVGYTDLSKYAVIFDLATSRALGHIKDTDNPL